MQNKQFQCNIDGAKMKAQNKINENPPIVSSCYAIQNSVGLSNFLAGLWRLKNLQKCKISSCSAILKWPRKNEGMK